MPLSTDEVRAVVNDAIREHEKREQQFTTQMRGEVLEIVGALRSDLQGISAKLSEVADLRGELKATRELCERVGRESKENERRIRDLEIATATQGLSTRRFDGLFDRIVYGALAAGLAGMTAYHFAGNGAG